MLSWYAVTHHASLVLSCHAGVRYPLEMHIVHLVYKDVLPGCGTGGCIAVLGVLFEVTNEAKGPEFLDTIFKNMPMQENASLTVIVLLQLPS